MKKLHVEDSVILNLAGSDLIYGRGVKYFEQGRIFGFSYKPESNMVFGEVEGGDSYTAVIKFDDEGYPLVFKCNCSYESPWGNCCKHVVALLKETQRVMTVTPLAQINDKSSNEIRVLFNLLGNINEEPFKTTPLKLEPTVVIDHIHGNSTTALELKLGTVRTYVVKDIKLFLKKYNSNEELEFGKNFTFNPSTQYFLEKDLEIIKSLDELQSYENSLVNENYYSSSSSFFKGKQAFLPSVIINRIFTNLLGRAVDVDIYGVVHKNIPIVKENLPLIFQLNSVNGVIEFSRGHDEIVPLGTNSSFYFYKDKIYMPNENQCKYLQPLNKVFSRRAVTTLSIGSKDLQRFCSEVLPILESVSNTTISENLKDRLIKQSLNAKIYFDKINNGISAVIEFNYGEEKLNPFSGDTNSSSEKIVIRNVQEEREILKHFEKYSFKVEKDRIYLDDEGQIYDFIYTSLPMLREIAELYYSESFKNIRVYKNTSFSGGIRLTDNSMLEFDFMLDGIDTDEIWNVLESIREKKRFYRLKNGAFLPLDNDELQSVARLADQLQLDISDFENQTVTLPKYRAMYIDNLLRTASLNNVEKSQGFKEMVQNIKEPQDMDYKVPKSLKKILRDYQKTGFKWLKTLSHYGFGGILADDMGLGKTLQVLSFIMAEKEKGSKPSLVIAPTSLVYNWRDEVYKFAPELKVLVISGVQKERVEQLKDINDSDLIVTSYALIRRDIELYEEYDFSYCFLDEAQHIKNPNTVNAKAVKQVKANGYFALTGTPVENSLTELWSIFDFIMPGYLMSHSDFVEKFETPIVKYNDETALNNLSMHIKPFILRRMKKDVLKELPDKIETKMTATLTDEQKKVYLAYLEKAKGEIAVELSQNGFNKSHIKILAILTRLRQICCHPSLFIDNYGGESGKMELLLEVLDDAFSSGHRVLIFSQFTSMLQIIATELERKEIGYFYLDGSTKPELRGEMVKAFNGGENNVFLISLKAGGTGLNLTGADMVIHYDPWWNPAVEDQASDRAYRIGQMNVVQVIKLITEGTIEERIFELQQKKKAMIDAVIQPGETMLTKLTETEIKALFDLE